MNSTFFMRLLLLAFSFLIINCAHVGSSKEFKTLKADKHLYLEEVYGKKALEWVEAQNLKSARVLENRPGFLPLKASALKLLDSPDKLIGVTFSDIWAYNFWQDAKNPQGLMRRISIEDYQKGLRNWEVLLDIDALSQKEGKKWVFKGSQRFKNRALITLSDGGKDAATVREFDLDSKTFIEDGFQLPEGKNSITWIDENTVFLGRALNADEVTQSGYPRTVAVWSRGTDYKKAPIVYEGNKTSVSVSAGVYRDEEFGAARYKVFSEYTDFFNQRMYVWRDDGQKIELKIPSDADATIERGKLFLKLKSNWTFAKKEFITGSLLWFDLEKFLADPGSVEAELLFKPKANSFLDGEFYHNGRIFLILSEDVKNNVVELIKQNGQWVQKKIKLPPNSSTHVFAYSQKMELLNFSSDSFINPTTVHSLDLTKNKIKKVDQAPSRFDSNLYRVDQFFAVSKDGTRVPYFVVRAKDVQWNGKNPTIIYAYGGFEVSSMPYYSAGIENAWLKAKGVWVVANIRGGGEYGPAWHKAGLKENRNRVYEDFFAVSEDLIRRKITNAKKLGAVGGSNGGLLMGVAMTQRPDLYKAIAIQVPLLDMLRFHSLLAGASWVGEYGSPDDPAMREYLLSYSPYHNLRTGIKYPEVFFMTSTADDRVHPGHARKMAAKMQEMGLPFYYYENTQGGHGGSANNEQRAKWTALQFEYFKMKLME